MKTFFSLLTLVLGFSVSANAGSGTFCNGANQKIEYVCGYTPGGYGWVPQADGCFHRDTGTRCDSWQPPAPPAPPAPYPGPGRPGPGYGGGVVCRADDRGWEEHSSHRSCGECLAQHGSCIETCSVSSTQCEARGYDYRGAELRFVGQGQSRYEAENQAIRNCAYSAGRCQVINCSSKEDVVSRRDCR